ncbi:RNA-binding protein 8A-like protein [Zopfochytrium polystomum]|nr:RNA-binding protein 8A-like protein [Zopfochytrium polystomum]
MADNFVDLDPGADDMVIDEDRTTRIKASVTKKKGRGFEGKTDFSRDDVTGGKFEALDAEGTGKAQRSVEGWIVIVSGVHEEATEEDVTERFAEYGSIKNLHLNLDRRTGYVKGYALIEYDTYKEAKAAIDGTAGTEFLGQKVSADFAFVRGPDGPSTSSGGGGHRR